MSSLSRQRNYSISSCTCSLNEIGLCYNCRIGFFPSNTLKTCIYAGLDLFANHTISSHITLGFMLHTITPKESILTLNLVRD